MGNLPIFSYEALRQSTNCFHKENELGVGGFRSVYLGKLWDGRIVAIKILYQDNSRRLEQFINEVKIFSTLNRPHGLRLYGCTPADSPELLSTNLSQMEPWPIIFMASNILLDENFDTKLADFGNCRLDPVDASHVATIAQGTPGYVDPEYYQCYQLTGKSDVYSFGVVLMEIVSAKIAMDINRNRREINLANLAITKIQEGALHELVDPQLEIEVNPEVKIMVRAVAELAFRCLASERDDRPDMVEVVAQLEKIRHSSGMSTGPGEEQLRMFGNVKEPNTSLLSPFSVQNSRPSVSSTPNTVLLSPFSMQGRKTSVSSTPNIST